MITKSKKMVNGRNVVVVEYVRDGLEKLIHETTTLELMMLSKQPHYLTRRQLSLVHHELGRRKYM